MVSKKMDCGGSRDIISALPEALIGHILSFLPTKEAASTSLLSRKWRYLFAFVHNLDFDDFADVNPREEENIPLSVKYFKNMVPYERVVHIHRRHRVPTSFLNFVDRVLALQGNSHVHKFSLKLKDGVDDPVDPVDPVRIFRWILNVLERGVSDLYVCVDLETECTFPSEIFISKTLVRLKIDSEYGPELAVEDVCLPKLKTLCLASVHPKDKGVGLSKLLAGCHMLEDLALEDLALDFSSVSVPTLKRLRFSWQDRSDNPKSVSFDTPNLVYLEYTETIADKYPKVNFGSLVEASVDLRMSDEQIGIAEVKEEATYAELLLQIHYAEGHEESELTGNATDFIVGICNVKILYLSANTLQVLTYSCEAIPLFNNLTHLTIESNPEIGWQSLPGLLKNSPNLETLVLLGLIHKATDRCGDICLCNSWYEKEWGDEEEEAEEEEEEEIHTSLSSSPVKVLKIMRFAETYDQKIEQKIKQVKHFLKTMPNLEQLIIYYDTTFDEDLIIVSSQLQALPRVASSRCNVQLISNHLSLSSTVPSSVSMKWAYLS